MAINVLILDESLMMRKILKRALAMTLISIEHYHMASSFSEGLAVLQDNEIELALVDYNMRTMGGISPFLELKKQQGAKTTKILALASHYTQTNVDELEEQNITLVHQPITPEQLQIKLKELF